MRPSEKVAASRAPAAVNLDCRVLREVLPARPISELPVSCSPIQDSMTQRSARSQVPSSGTAERFPDSAGPGGQMGGRSIEEGDQEPYRVERRQGAPFFASGQMSAEAPRPQARSTASGQVLGAGSRGRFDVETETVVEDAAKKPARENSQAGQGVAEAGIGPAEVGIGGLAILNLLGTAYREYRVREIVYHCPKRTVRAVDRLDKSSSVLRMSIGCLAALWLLVRLWRSLRKKGRDVTTKVRAQYSTTPQSKQRTALNERHTSQSVPNGREGAATEAVAPGQAGDGVLHKTDPAGSLQPSVLPSREGKELPDEGEGHPSSATGTFTRHKKANEEKGVRAWLGAAMVAAVVAALGTAVRARGDGMAPVHFRGWVGDREYASGRRVSTPRQTFEKGLWAVSAGLGIVAAVKMLLSWGRRRRRVCQRTSRRKPL